MKRKLQKVTSVIAIGAIVAASLSGCGKTPAGSSQEAKAPASQTAGSEEAGTVTEPEVPGVDTETVEEFTVLVTGSQASLFNWDNPVAEEITRRTGVKLVPELVLDDPEQRVALMMSSGEYTDLVLNANTTLDKLIDSGSAVQLDDLIDQYGPDIKAFYGDKYNRIRSTDGHIYCFGSGASKQAENTPGQYWNLGFYVQNQALENQGYPEVKTPEDFENVIRKELEEHPTTEDGQKRYGLSLITADGWRYQFSITHAANLVNGLPLDGDYYYNQETGLAELAMRQTYMKEYIQWYNKLYNDGLIDPESFTQNYDTYLAKISTGRVIGVVDGFWQASSAVSSLRSEGKGDLCYSPFTPLWDPDTMVWEGEAGGNVAQPSGFTITTSCKNPAKIVNFFNFLASEEGQILTEWGIEGVNYTIGADGQRVRNPEDIEAETADSQAAMAKTGVKMYARDAQEWLHQPYGYKTSNGQLLINENLSDPNAGLTDKEIEVLGAYGYETFADAFPSTSQVPSRSYGALDSVSIGTDEDIAVIYQKYTDCKLPNLAKAIMCAPEEFEETWQGFMDEIDATGIDKLMAVLNDNLADRKAQWGVE